MNLQDITRLYDFSGRIAVVPGGTGALGGAIARTLLGCGAHVAVLSRHPEQAEQVLSGIGGQPGAGRVLALYGDVVRRDTLLQAADRIRQEFGAVDVLVNAAGGNQPKATTAADRSFFDLPDEALRQVSDLNLLGTVLPCQIFGRDMAEQGEGNILNISSMNAFRPLTRIPAYSAAKAGINNFTHWLAVHMAQEYSPHIRVNAIAPGFFLTHQNRFLLTDEKTGELTDRGRTIIEHTPMGRFGVPEDLVGAALWLLSPASDFVTGIVVPVDGGFSAFSGV